MSRTTVVTRGYTCDGRGCDQSLVLDKQGHSLPDTPRGWSMFPKVEDGDLVGQLDLCPSCTKKIDAVVGTSWRGGE